MTKVLLVEDEPHKIEEILRVLREHYGSHLSLEHVDSVNAAYWAVSAFEFDVVILDMALPTFSTDGGATERGQDQALGGIEVLRALKARDRKPSVIIITQYPEITIGGQRVKLSKAPSLLSKRYEQAVIGGVLYKYGAPSNGAKLTNLLRSVK